MLPLDFVDLPPEDVLAHGLYLSGLPTGEEEAHTGLWLSMTRVVLERVRRASQPQAVAVRPLVQDAQRACQPYSTARLPFYLTCNISTGPAALTRPRFVHPRPPAAVALLSGASVQERTSLVGPWASVGASIT